MTDERFSDAPAEAVAEVERLEDAEASVLQLLTAVTAEQATVERLRDVLYDVWDIATASTVPLRKKSPYDRCEMIADCVERALSATTETATAGDSKKVQR